MSSHVRPASSRDRYGSDVLATDWRAPKRGRAVETAAEKGMVVEEVSTDWCGEVVAVERDLDTVTLEDRQGRRRTFPLGPGFLLEGKPVILRPAGPVRPRRRPPAPRRGRSRCATSGRGWREAAGSSWRVATTPSWSRRSGVTTCASRASSWSTSPASTTSAGHLDDFGPAPDDGWACSSTTWCRGPRRAGSPRTSWRGPYAGDVLVVGHPYVDVWQSVRPSRLGLDAWPTIPRDVEWKKGICRHLGWPHADQADIARAWKRILGTVRSYQDLEPALLGRVEELIDFVTAPA